MATNFRSLGRIEKLKMIQPSDRTFTPVYLHFADLFYPGKT